MFKATRDTLYHGIIYGIGQTLTSAAGFFLIPVYTNYLSPEDYGLASLLSVTISALMAIFSFGIYSALFRSFYDYDNDRDREVVISTALYLLLLSAVFLQVIGFFGSGIISNLLFGTEYYKNFLLCSFLTAGFQLLQAIPFAVYRIRQASKQYSLYTILFFFIRIGLILCLVISFQLGVWGVVLGNLIASVISTIVLIWSLRKHLILAISKLEVEKMLRFGLPIVIVDLTGLVLNISDRYFLEHFGGLSQVGIYSLGYQIGMVIQILLVQPMKLIWPPMMFAVEKTEYAHRFYSRILTYFLFVGFWAFLAVSLLSDNVLRLIANPSYWSAPTVIPLICVAYILMGIQEILNVGLAIHRRTEFYAYVFVIGAVVNVVLNLVLIPNFGMMGAAYATVIAFLVICITKYIVARQFYPIDYEWGRIAKLIFSTGVVYLVGMQINSQSILLSLLGKILVIASFPVLLLMLSFLKNDEFTRLSETRKMFIHSGYKRIKRLTN